MIRIFFLIIGLTGCFSQVNGSPGKPENHYDIFIYGGTSAGVIAAYTAKKLGKTVVLIVPDNHIGGLSSGGLGNTDIGNKRAIGGYSRQFYQRLGKLYGEVEVWRFEPSKASSVFNDFLTEGEIPVITGRKISQVNKRGNSIVSVDLSNTYGSNRKRQTITAGVFLDCTYEGDLLALAGVSYTIGRESNSLYNENWNGYQLAEFHKRSGFHQFPDGVSPYVIPGDPSSGLVWGIGNDSPSPTGQGDKKIQAYNIRLCLTDSAENRIPIKRPKGYNPAKYELMVRLIAAQPDIVRTYMKLGNLPNRKTDINNYGGFSTDMIGANYQWPEATFKERKKILEQHISYTKGLFYFFINDKRIPDSLRKSIAKWGYPKDEYVHTHHFTPQLYVREARRMIGEYVMSEHNCTGKESVADSIGMAAYTMDSHNVQRIVVNGMVKNEGNVEVGGFPPYPISYRSIVPQRSECTNLLVPVCLSASHIAFGSIRMEPVFMVLGQSAATAAVQSLNEGKAVQDIDYQQLRSQLQQMGQILSLPKK